MYLGRLGQTQLPYSCTSSICYGIGSYHDTILQLQNAINRFVALVPSLNAIAADGKIGAGTVSALKKIQDWLPNDAAAGPLKLLLAQATISKEGVAGSAAGLVKSLSQYTGTSPSSKPSVPAQPPDKPTSAGTTISPAPAIDIFRPPGESGSNTKWLALGGVVTLAIGFLVYRNYKEHAG